ncbi:MAG: hypothetical protein H6673_03550 [Anaerolineales bacterium]|nr:hypothetical protein [Anaerolineales bacterium]
MKATFWTLTTTAVLAVIPYHFLYDETAISGRTLLVIGALGLPLFLLYLQYSWSWDELLGTNVDPVSIALSGLAGLAIWPIAWWLMGWLQDEVLFDLTGAYSSPAIYRPTNLESIWTLLVITDVVIIPLALMLLLWGAARWQLQRSNKLPATLILAFYAGVLGMLLFRQGIVGFVGYGLCGLVAAVVSLQTRSAWAGLATQGVFVYADLDLLDNLTTQMAKRSEDGTITGIEPYWGMQWLALVLISALVVVALLQVIRFRHERQTNKAEPLNWTLGTSAAFGVSLLVVVFVFTDEIIRRVGGS